MASPRLLYVVSEDWYFLSHRLPMARAAKAAGFEVHVATRVSEGARAIRAEGFTLHPIPFVRGRLSPRGALATIAALRRIHRAIEPALAHHVALQPAVLGSIAALGRPAICINALTGLGYAFTSASAKARMLRGGIGLLLRRLIDRRNAIALVQNPDDRAALVGLGISDARIVLIPGSGVDTAALGPLPEPAGPPAAGFVGRLLDDKGIRTLIAAHRLLRQRGSDLRLLIAGTPDPANPASVSEAEVAQWNVEPGVVTLGHVADIAGFWARTHFAVLPSRREGFPKALLEAAACGRPMVATDVPGCREIVREGETGLLVAPDDPAALADAMERLAQSAMLRFQYGAAARKLIEQHFSAGIIGRETVALYRRLFDAGRTSP